MRPRLDYGDVVYDQPNLTSKIEWVQHNAALDNTDAFRGPSK